MLNQYKSTKTRAQRFVGLMLAGAIALLAGTSTAAADETYVVDPSVGTGGALFRVDAISGDRSLISDFGDALQGPVGDDPRDLAPEAAGTVLVIDPSAGTGGFGALFRVDPASGERSLVSDFGNRAQGPLGFNPRGLGLEAGGTVLVIDDSAGTDFSGVLFRVDPISGDRSLVSNFGNATQGPLVAAPRGLALEAAGTVLVIDRNAGTPFRGALFRVDPASGVRNLVSDFGNATQGALGMEPIDLVLEAGGSVLVIDEDAGMGARGALLRLDAISGNRSLVSDFGNAAQGPLGTNLRGLALEAGGTVLVIDEQAGTGGLGMLFAVDQISGLRVQVSDFGDAAQGALGRNPVGVAVVVPDTTPPETRIDDRPPDPDTQTTATLRFSGTDDASPPAALDFECELDGGGFSTCTSPKTFADLQPRRTRLPGAGPGCGGPGRSHPGEPHLDRRHRPLGGCPPVFRSACHPRRYPR